MFEPNIWGALCWVFVSLRLKGLNPSNSFSGSDLSSSNMDAMSFGYGYLDWFFSSDDDDFCDENDNDDNGAKANVDCNDVHERRIREESFIFIEILVFVFVVVCDYFESLVLFVVFCRKRKELFHF